MRPQAFLAAAAVAAAGMTVKAQDAVPQDPPKPVVLALARPMLPVEAAARLTGTWKLNEELSPPLRAGSSPTAAQDRRPGGNNGRPQAYEVKRLIEERNIRVRALYRELAVAPETLTLTVSVAVAKFVDPDGAERLVNINQKKEKLDLGTAIVDSRSQWNGTSLTIELDGGPDLRVIETFELAPTGTQMLVTIRAGDEHDPNTRVLRGQVQRVYDRVHPGHP
jgi:hypothetical protein